MRNTEREIVSERETERQKDSSKFTNKSLIRYTILYGDLGSLNLTRLLVQHHAIVECTQRSLYFVTALAAGAIEDLFLLVFLSVSLS